MSKRIKPEVRDIQDCLLIADGHRDESCTPRLDESSRSSNFNSPILIVEDNSLCHYALASILEQYQMSYDSAYDGGQAIELVK